MKAELLTSFDTLASHLVTTFSALSTALARVNASPSSNDDEHVGRAYMAILVGPSLGTARSKVIYGVDRFATRIWGTREEVDEADEESSGGEECPEDSEDDEDDGSSEDGSLEETESDEDAPDGDDRTNDESFQDEKEAKDEVDEDKEVPIRPENDYHHDHPPHLPIPHQSYAEEQRFLHTADRLLARVLASADTEGHGISNEMCKSTPLQYLLPTNLNSTLAPSQIHILLRAPRRFVHPVWVPRQNIQKQMEATLTDFINQSRPLHQIDEELPTKKKKPVEGVWVTAKNGLRDPFVALDKDVNGQEEDEMIWWSWDGKLVGFTDW